LRETAKRGLPRGYSSSPWLAYLIWLYSGMGRLLMQGYQERKEKIERREFKLLVALIQKLKTVAAVLEHI
jgi:hypothetical protein